MSWEEEFPDDEMMMDKKKVGPPDDNCSEEKESDKVGAKEDAEKTEMGAPSSEGNSEEQLETKKEPSDSQPAASSENQPEENPTEKEEKTSENVSNDPSNDSATEAIPKSEVSKKGNLFGDKEKGPLNDESKEKEAMKVGKLANIGKTPEKIENPPGRTPPRKSVTESYMSASKAESKKGSDDVIHEVEARLDKETEQLLKDIRRVGEAGKPEVTFGELFVDPEVEQYYEALVGTLKSAKKRRLIDFEGQMLLKGPHDKVVISIVKQ